MAQRGYRWYFRRGRIEVDPETRCWIWLGAQYPDGYGKIRGRTERRLPMRAQRYFWELYKGSAQGYDIGHNCHRRLCVNIKHLTMLSHSENMQLMFVPYPFGKTDRELVMKLMNEDRTVSFIADSLMAPRPAVMKLIRDISPEWRGSF